MAVLTANCQNKDNTFDVRVRFNQGFEFADGTRMNTAGTGVGVVTWDAITLKPTLFPPSAHNHDLLYKPASWMPTWSNVLNKPVFSAVATSGSFNDLTDVPEFIQLEEALALLNSKGSRLTVLTQVEINAIAPIDLIKGLFLFNDTEGVLQVYNGIVWKTIITNK